MSKLNLDNYRNDDLYIYTSLKILDDETFNILKQNEYTKFEKLDNNIISLYDENRQNVIRWYNFKNNSDILEVNGCFGAMTSYLCKISKSVTTIEFSKKNAEIINNRLSNENNLEIIAGNLKNISIKKQFDYIILNDILEFSTLFFEEKNSEKIFFDYFKNLLKPDGSIIIILNNRYGIKNWLGKADEHTLYPFDNLIDYEQIRELKSFSYNELKVLLQDNFQFINFYYPLPNIQNTKAVFTDKSLTYLHPNEDFEKFTQNILPVNELDLTDSIAKNKEFSFFANSFFVVVSNSQPKKEQIIYSKVKDDKITNIISNNGKLKICKKQKEFKKPKLENIKLLNYTKSDELYISEYFENNNLYITALNLINRNDFDNLLVFIKDFQNLINSMFASTKKMTFSDKELSPIELKGIKCTKNTPLNTYLTNFIKTNDEYTILDYDNIYENYIPVNYLIFKGIHSLNNTKYNIDIYKIFKHLNFNDEELMLYSSMLMKY